MSDPFLDLEAVAAEPSEQPRFVFAHLMITHQPFVFNRDGSIRAVENTACDNAVYLDQLIYATGLITQTVTRILECAPQPPVIILQGDHGFRYLKGDTADRTKEGFSMLSAILLPGLKDADWPEHLPPVNTFRLVFNHLFDAGLPYETNFVASEAIHTDLPED